MTVNISQLDLVFKHLLIEILFEMAVGTWPGFGPLNHCSQLIPSRKQTGNSVCFTFNASASYGLDMLQSYKNTVKKNYLQVA